MKNDLSLLRTVPQILRARGYRLYTKDNRRLIDLWLNGGAAVLGHTPANILRELKNTASRGLYAPFPHFTEGRLIKALLRLFPQHVFRFYAGQSFRTDWPQELAALLAAGKARLWRPFVNPDDPFAVNSGAMLSGILLLALPVPFNLCVAAARSEEQFAALPPSDILPPVLLAVAARGVYDLLASPQRAKPELPRTFQMLKSGGCPWRRQGIYLTLKEEPDYEKWKALFRMFLEAGFLLPPSADYPLILPGELSGGEDAKLAGVIGKNCQNQL